MDKQHYIGNKILFCPVPRKLSYFSLLFQIPDILPLGEKHPPNILFLYPFFSLALAAMAHADSKSTLLIKKNCTVKHTLNFFILILIEWDQEMSQMWMFWLTGCVTHYTELKRISSMIYEFKIQHFHYYKLQIMKFQ